MWKRTGRTALPAIGGILAVCLLIAAGNGGRREAGRGALALAATTDPPGPVIVDLPPEPPPEPPAAAGAPSATAAPAGLSPGAAAPRPAGPRTRTIRMLVTAYCPCRVCCGRHSDGKTASGRSIYANGSHFVAADTRLLPFGTRLSVPGYYGGAPVPVLDRGGRIVGRRLDVFFRSHARAKRWGRRWLDVTVYTGP